MFSRFYSIKEKIRAQVNIATLFLKETIKEFSKELCERGNDILNLIKKSHISIASDDREEFRIAWNNFLVEIEYAPSVLDGFSAYDR